MDTVLAAVILIFVVLLAVFTFSGELLSAQETLQESWQDMQRRADDQAATAPRFIDAYTANGGTDVMLTLENQGASRWADFDHWDILLHYYETSSPSNLHILRQPLASGVPESGQWSLEGIYADASAGTLESFEAGIVNPGEQLVLWLKTAPGVGQGAAAQVTISTGNGVTTSTVLAGNLPPTLVTNQGITVAALGTLTISAAHLWTEDGDDVPADLVYTIEGAPTQGSLSTADSFTQQDIDHGLLSYTNTGSGPDSFQFTISDGKDSAGPYAFLIQTSELPTLTALTGLTMLSGGTATIDTLRMQVSDADDQPSTLIYTVTHGPVQGTLNLGNTFTQQDIDDGLLTYTHSGVGPDSFQFTVSDGETEIGPFNFNIAV